MSYRLEAVDDPTALAEAVCGMVEIAGREAVEAHIRQAHNGRPDGWMVTDENLHLFRQYRNRVSPSAAQLVEDCIEFEGR